MPRVSARVSEQNSELIPFIPCLWKIIIYENYHSPQFACIFPPIFPFVVIVCRHRARLCKTTKKHQPPTASLLLHSEEHVSEQVSAHTDPTASIWYFIFLFLFRLIIQSVSRVFNPFEKDPSFFELRSLGKKKKKKRIDVPLQSSYLTIRHLVRRDYSNIRAKGLRKK